MNQRELYAALFDVCHTLVQDNISDTEAAQQMLKLIQIRSELDQVYCKLDKIERLVAGWSLDPRHEYYTECLEGILNGT